MWVDALGEAWGIPGRNSKLRTAGEVCSCLLHVGGSTSTGGVGRSVVGEPIEQFYRARTGGADGDGLQKKTRRQVEVEEPRSEGQAKCRHRD